MTDFCKLTLSGNQKITSVAIYNSASSQIDQIDLSKTEVEEYNVDVADYERGVYWVKVKSVSGDIFVKEFICR